MSECCKHDGCSKPAAPAIPDAVAGPANTTLRVAGMDCADEVAAIERALKPVAGVKSVRVNLMGGTVAIGHDESITAEKLIEEIGKAGLKATAAEGANDESSSIRNRRLISVAISGVLTAIGLAFQWAGLSAYVQIPAFALAVVAGGWFIFPKTISALRHYTLDMNVLMTVAVIGAAAIGEWSEGASVVFLFALSELLESFSVARARRAIQSLMSLTPDTALLKEGENFREVPVKEVVVGNLIAVRSGARVPLDGEVTGGVSTINQAPITGESMPVEKKAGDTVFAGTINGEGSLEVRVTKAVSDTTLARIIQLVDNAQSQKAPSQQFVDKFARYYTPSVFVMALLVGLVPPLAFGGEWFSWTYRALVLLVIACPCALVISTPVSVVSGLTAMAKRGVLIKGGAFLEAVGKLRALAVDKTGTITEGKPRVGEIELVNSKWESEVIQIAAAIDIHSDHPLAQAVVAYARQNNVQFSPAENYQSRSGKGAEGSVNGHEYFVGNHRFAHELGVCNEALERKLGAIESRAMSVVVVGHKPHDGCAGDVLGVLAVGDAVRPEAAEAIKSLRATGIQKILMLSGDNQKTANAIAAKVGIDQAFGDLLPDQKIERVRALKEQFQHVGMIGDGVNDAPAMAIADVGIAMGAAGTDTAIETADMALMQDDLSKVAEAIELGRRTVRVIQANIAFALAVKALFLVLALSGHTSLWMAILADTGATLVVIANALRLLK